MSVALPPLDPVLARDYPRALRDAYRNALRRESLAERHQQLLRLGESSLAYLASLAFSDYRRTFGSDADRRVEEFLASTKRFTMGQYLALFRLTQKALGHPEIFGLKRYEVDVQLEHAQRWVSAVRAIEYAQRVGASDMRRVVDEGLKQPAKRVRWLAFWDELVSYRNQIAHADANEWPLDATGYFEAMTPTLEAALVDALRTEYIGHVLLEYPTAHLLGVRRSREGWVQRFDGEYRGVPLLEEVERDSPPDPWESEVACTYVLQRSETGWLPHSRFYDLSHEVPEPLSPRAAARAAGSVGTPQPATAAKPPTENRSGSGPGSAPDTPQNRAHPGSQTTDSSNAQLEGGTASHVTTGRESPDAIGEAARGTSDSPAGGAASASEIRMPTHEIAETRTDHRPAPDNPPAWFPSFSPWMLWGILSLGFLACVGFIVTADRTRDVQLRNAGIAYGVAAVIVLVIAGIVGDSDAYPVLDAIFATLLVGTWFVSTVHAFAVNPRVRRERARAHPEP